MNDNPIARRRSLCGLTYDAIAAEVGCQKSAAYLAVNTRRASLPTRKAVARVVNEAFRRHAEKVADELSRMEVANG